MITPVNSHILIEPVKHESFMATQKGTYEEIGVVLEFDESCIPLDYTSGKSAGQLVSLLKKGDKVYFDSWLAAKYPKNDEEWYWLVKWEDVRAIEHVEIPK